MSNFQDNLSAVMEFVEIRKPGHINRRRGIIKRLMNPVKAITRTVGTRMFSHRSAAHRATDFRWL